MVHPRAHLISDLALLDAMLVNHLTDGTGGRAGHAARTHVGPDGTLQRAVIAGKRIRSAQAERKQEGRGFLDHGKSPFG